MSLLEDTGDLSAVACFLPLVRLGAVLFGEFKESSFAVDNVESTDVALSSRRSLVFPANSFIEPMLAAAALLFLVVAFSGDLLVFASSLDLLTFLLPRLVVLISGDLDFSGEIIVTLRLDALALFDLLGETIGDSVCVVVCFRVDTFFSGEDKLGEVAFLFLPREVFVFCGEGDFSFLSILRGDACFFSLAALFPLVVLLFGDAVLTFLVGD